MVADPVRTLRSLPPVGELIINFPFRCCGAFHTLILESAASYSVRQTIRYSMGRLSSSIAYRDIPLRTDGVDGPIEARDAFPLVSPHTRRAHPTPRPSRPAITPPIAGRFSSNCLALTSSHKPRQGRLHGHASQSGNSHVFHQHAWPSPRDLDSLGMSNSAGCCFVCAMIALRCSRVLI
jgi:hypothetical protein